MSDTIYALSSGALPSGIAVVRVSGNNCQKALARMCRRDFPWPAKFLDNLYRVDSEDILDRILILNFDGPASFTGEDVVELHLHGGVAVVQAVLDDLSRLSGFRHAEAGEFTMRAFENGKLDLTQVEGISDLIASETEAQRASAVDQAGGKLRIILESYAQRLLKIRSVIEADIDFVEEDDIPDNLTDAVAGDVLALSNDVVKLIGSSKFGEIVRNGFSVALLGPPNSGKSTLLNALAQRDVAIVSDIAGTTRDVLEAKLDLDGYAVRVLDTAGIRQSKDSIELEGMRRARMAAETADFRIWLSDSREAIEQSRSVENIDYTLQTKGDLNYPLLVDSDLKISASTGEGIPELLDLLRDRVNSLRPKTDGQLVTRQRHLSLLQSLLNNLRLYLEPGPPEIRAEYLRLASDSLSRVTGKMDVEDILGLIFAEFCVGK